MRELRSQGTPPCEPDIKLCEPIGIKLQTRPLLWFDFVTKMRLSHIELKILLDNNISVKITKLKTIKTLWKYKYQTSTHDQ